MQLSPSFSLGPASIRDSSSPGPWNGQTPHITVESCPEKLWESPQPPASTPPQSAPHHQQPPPPCGVASRASGINCTSLIDRARSMPIPSSSPQPPVRHAADLPTPSAVHRPSPISHRPSSHAWHHNVPRLPGLPRQRRSCTVRHVAPYTIVPWVNFSSAASPPLSTANNLHRRRAQVMAWAGSCMYVRLTVLHPVLGASTRLVPSRTSPKKSSALCRPFVSSSLCPPHEFR